MTVLALALVAVLIVSIGYLWMPRRWSAPFIAAGFAAPFAILLAVYGTASPCGALATDIQREALMKSVSHYEDVGIVLGTAFARPQIDALGPIRCTGALWERAVLAKLRPEPRGSSSR